MPILIGFPRCFTIPLRAPLKHLGNLYEMGMKHLKHLFSAFEDT